MTDEPNKINIELIISNILATLEREREREIVARRFGLFDRKETLEQIGELLGITRERVRQLEKVIIQKLKSSALSNKLPHIEDTQKILKGHLNDLGSIARVHTISGRLSSDNTRIDQSRVAFLAELCPKILVINDSDDSYHTIALVELGDIIKINQQVTEIINAISKIAEPVHVEKIAEAINNSDIKRVAALAGTSKQLATLNNRWGLIKWPMVNPKNIRDKIYVILKENGKHMHFNEISKSIKGSSFKRKDVTTQAIHNELIKDKRFVLIGRGIYALKEWGYEKGTVSDIISDVLKKANEPLHRDEIVKRVLKSRYVKETTILLNLQAKQQFKRVAKATYTLSS